MITNHFRNLIMGNVFGTDKTNAIPTEYFIGLSKTSPAIDGTGATEPAAPDYARVKLTSLSVPTNGSITNTAPISFAESLSNWGVVTHFVIYDAATGGNLLAYDLLTKPRTIESESEVMFKTESLKINLLNTVPAA